jgi:hypothetical protein
VVNLHILVVRVAKEDTLLKVALVDLKLPRVATVARKEAVPQLQLATPAPTSNF